MALARSNGLPLENYWLYFKKDGTAVDAYAEENKRKGWVGLASSWRMTAVSPE